VRLWIAQEHWECRDWKFSQQDSARTAAVVASVHGRLMLQGSLGPMLRVTTNHRPQPQHMPAVDPSVRPGNGVLAMHPHAISHDDTR
jgi:hypothetical protein